MEKAAKSGQREKSALLCISRLAASSCPVLWAQAPATLTPGSEKQPHFLAAYITARLKTAPDAPMQKDGVKSPVNNSAVSISLAARYSSVCRSLKRYRQMSVTILASPGLMPIGTGSGSRLSAKRSADAAAASSASVIKILVLVKDSVVFMMFIAVCKRYGSAAWHADNAAAVGAYCSLFHT